MLSKQTALFRQMDVVANNIANADTNGFKAEKMLFDDYLINDGNRKKMAFTQDISTYREDVQGGLKVTGGTLDIAISGKGYFTLQTPNGLRYSRAGALQIGADGSLVTANGYQVLDNGGQPIQFAPEDKNIVIGEGGNISVDGQEKSSLSVVEFANPQNLTQVGDAMFRADDAPLPAQSSRVLQGVLEKSNVEPIKEIVDMTKLSRSVNSTAKFIEVAYDLQRKASSAYAQANQS